MDIVEYAEKICGRELHAWQRELLRRVDSLPRDHKLVYCLGRRRWVIVKESELSNTNIVPLPHKGYHSRICIIDETVNDKHVE